MVKSEALFIKSNSEVPEAISDDWVSLYAASRILNKNIGTLQKIVRNHKIESRTQPKEILITLVNLTSAEAYLKTAKPGRPRKKVTPE